MLDVVKMKESCRICARELLGNQRRWIFHPAAKLNLQVLLSHALGLELTRDGRGEFACSKCTFMLDRMYRFDTVIARVEALSLERLHKLLLEKERLRLCIGGMYRKHNTGDGDNALDVDVPPAEAAMMDLSTLQGGRYTDLVQDDLTYSVYESWAEKEDAGLDQHQEQHHCTRRCRGCAALRVPDSEYEAVCKVPRIVGRRSTSCGPATRYSPSGEDPTGLTDVTSAATELPSAALDTCDPTSPSPATSVESLDEALNVPLPKSPHRLETPERNEQSSGLEMVLSLVRGWEYQPLKPQRGSRLPVLVRPIVERGSFRIETDLRLVVPDLVVPCPQLQLQAELAEMEDQWLDDYVQCRPFQQGLMQEHPGQNQSVGDLQAAQQQVRSLQNKIRESESRNQKQQERLCQVELELQSTREEAQQQERNIQNIRDSVQAREEEASQLHRVIEEQNVMLCSLKELADGSQLQQLQASGSKALLGQTEVLALQASLFRAQLELQAGQRSQIQAARTHQDLGRALQRLETDLQGALQQRRETDKHNQELLLALEETRSLLQQQEAQRSDDELASRREKEEREKEIQELATLLQSKERLLQDYCELLDDSTDKRDSRLHKLRQRITERDRALERAVDDKFRCVEQKDEENRGLQLLLREKERDLERQRCVLSNNQETITSLEVLLRGKSLELQQVSDTCRNVQVLQQGAAERQSRILRESDGIISQLQGALQAQSQELQDLRCALISGVQSGPSEVLEELKVRLQLKDHLFQEVLSDRTRQAQDHQDQIQDLLRTIGSRDLYIQDSAGRLSEVMGEQTSRLQELRRQLSSRPDSGPDPAAELDEVKEDLRLLLRRQKESEQVTRGQSRRLETLSRTLLLKEKTIEELQQQLVQPSELPLVQRLTLEVQELRESLALQEGLPAREHMQGLDEGGRGGPTELRGLSSEEEEEEEEDLSSDFMTSVDEEEGPVRRKSSNKGCGSEEGLEEGPGLVEVQQLVQQKRAVERELCELKLQLEKTGFCSLSQMRKALVDLRQENQELKLQLTQDLRVKSEEDEEEEELDVTIEEVDQDQDQDQEDDMSEMWDTWEEGLSLSHRPTMTRPTTLALHADSDQKQQSRHLKQRLMVSEATVQAQAEQIRDYRDLLSDGSVKQDSKQVQVDLQDLGYETSGRSENEAEREDTSSPEFDDLEMCTSLDSQWWPSSLGKTPGPEGPSLQRLVEDLRSQLSRSQTVIRGLQGRLRTQSSSDGTPRKVNFLSAAEDDEGWQSSDGGNLSSPKDKDLRDLVSRVDALEDQLMRSGKKTGEQGSWPGKFNVLIQTQARDLSHLRQRLREARGVTHILTQQLSDTTKTFEELLRSSDVDFYAGQNFRQQLAQSSALAQRVSAKISGRDHPEDPEEKTELLAIRLSRELQQKDKVIESLRDKLDQHQLRRSTTPTSSNAPSDATDQSDRISYVSDEQNEELSSDVDAASELAPDGTRSRGGTDCQSRSSCPHPSPSVTPSHGSLAESLLRSAEVPLTPTGFSTPQSRPLQGFPPLIPQQPEPSSFLPFSFHGYQTSPFGSCLDPNPKAGASFLQGGPVWDVSFGPRSMRVGADLSSGSSGYQSGTSHTGSDLMKEHLREIRSLRERLEDSIQTNERLRRQLEERLTQNIPEKGAPTNIYIQGLDSVGQLSTEIRFLKEENVSLQNQLDMNTTEVSKEAERLKQASLLDQSRLREAELECDKWAEQSRKLQADAEENQQEVNGLKLERQTNQEAINRLQHELNVVQQQLCESRRLVCSLQCELEVRQRVCEASAHPDLREELEKQPSGRTESRSGARKQLFHGNRRHDQVPDGCSVHQNRMVVQVDHFDALARQVQLGFSLLNKMDAVLRSLNASQNVYQSLDFSSTRELLTDTQALRRILQDSETLLQRFWREDVPNTSESQQDEPKVASLRMKLSQQEQALRDALEKVHSSNRTKDSMEDYIVNQLSRTRDVLRRAKTNLQVRSREESLNSPSLLVQVS